MSRRVPLSIQQRDILRDLERGWTLHYDSAEPHGTWTIRGRCASGDGYCYSYPHGTAALGLLRRGLIARGEVGYAITDEGRAVLRSAQPILVAGR